MRSNRTISITWYTRSCAPMHMARVCGVPCSKKASQSTSPRAEHRTPVGYIRADTVLPQTRSIMGGTQSAHLHHRDPRARHHDRPAQHFPQQPHCFGNLTFDTTPRQGLDAWPAPQRRAWIQHPQAPAQHPGMDPRTSMLWQQQQPGMPAVRDPPLRPEQLRAGDPRAGFLWWQAHPECVQPGMRPEHMEPGMRPEPRAGRSANGGPAADRRPARGRSMPPGAR